MKRIYVVVVEDGKETRYLVRAATAAQAIRQVAHPMFSASVASQDELIELTHAGVKVQEASNG